MNLFWCVQVWLCGLGCKFIGLTLKEFDSFEFEESLAQHGHTFPCLGPAYRTLPAALLTCHLNCLRFIYCSSSQRVLRGSQWVRNQFPEDPWIHYM